MVEMNDVVAKLALLTEQGQAAWRTTVDKSAFAATFGSLSVIIRADAVSGPEDTSSYRLSVLDERGNEIDYATAAYAGDPSFIIPHSPPLASLYVSAKRTALGSDKRLEELMSEMDRVSRA